LAADVASVHDQVAGPARLGVIGTTARWLVPRLVEAMAARHPRVQVVIHDATTSSLLLQLASGTIDLAVLSLPVTDPDVQAEPLFDEDRMLVTPTDHPFADHERISLESLDGVPILLEPPGSPFRDQREALAEERDVTLVPQVEVDGTRLMASLAFQGFGPAILPASAAPTWLGGDWRRIPVDDLPGRSVGLGTRRRGLLSSPGRALREVLHQVVAETGPDQPGVHPTTPDAPSPTAPPAPGGPRSRRAGNRLRSP
jgi:LysR family hydrogen peroxide-inducible transcriptional activator